MKDYTYYYTYDLPVPYKDINIYPAEMKDYFYFHLLCECLLVDKNSIPDIKVIQMSYLEYLFSYHNETNLYLYKLDGLLKLVLRDENIDIKYGKNEQNKPVIQIKDKFYDSDDFDEIKRIICEFNDVDLIDETISKEVRDKMKEADNLRMRINGNKMASLEDQLIAVMITTSLNLEQIKSLSIRKFSRILSRVDHKLHYEIYLSASMSGFVKFEKKDAIKHWLSDLTRDKFEGRMVEFDSIKSKISPVAS